nr:Eukaryotic translation initiation factor 4H [Hymenolepis microstoma]
MSTRKLSAPQAPSYRVYVGNLPKTCIQAHIEQILDGCQISNIHMVRDQNTDEFKGYAYAELRDETSYQKALSYDKTIVNGKEVRVNDADRNRNNRGGRGGFNGNARSGRGGSGTERNDFRGQARGGGYKPKVQPDALNRFGNQISASPSSLAPSFRPPPVNGERPTIHPDDPNRPRISLKPRTVPLNPTADERELTERAKSIFGVGKPRPPSPLRNTEDKE